MQEKSETLPRANSNYDRERKKVIREYSETMLKKNGNISMNLKFAQYPHVSRRHKIRNVHKGSLLLRNVFPGSLFARRERSVPFCGDAHHLSSPGSEKQRKIKIITPPPWSRRGLWDKVRITRWQNLLRRSSEEDGHSRPLSSSRRVLQERYTGWGFYSPFFWRGTGICKTFLNYILACHFLLMLIHIVRKILKQLLRVKPVRNINKVMVPQERKLKYYKNLDI